MEEHLEETRQELYHVERNVSRYGTDRVRELMGEIGATLRTIHDLQNVEAARLYYGVKEEQNA